MSLEAEPDSVSGIKPFILETDLLGDGDERPEHVEVEVLLGPPGLHSAVFAGEAVCCRGGSCIMFRPSSGKEAGS